MKNKNLFILFILFLVWLFATITFIKDQDYSFKDLEGRFGPESIQISRSGEMMKGDTVIGEFHSKYDGLGIVAVRFYTFFRANKDILRFSLKEKGSRDWYYSATYKTDQFQNDKMFPFGFPVISNSKNKNYEFKLESLAGATGSGVFVHPLRPTFITHNIFSKKQFFSSVGDSCFFIYNKLTNLLTDDTFRNNTLSFLAPLIAFLVFLELGEFFNISILILLSTSLWQIFGFVEFHYFIYLSLIFYWLLLSSKHKVDYTVCAFFSIAFLILSLILNLLKLGDFAELSSIWSFIFLIITGILIVLDSWNLYRPTIGLNKFWKKNAIFLKTFGIYIFVSIKNIFSYSNKSLKIIKDIEKENRIRKRIQDSKTIKLYKFIISNKLLNLLFNIFIISLLLIFIQRMLGLFIKLKQEYFEYYQDNYFGPFLKGIIVRTIVITTLSSMFCIYIYKYTKQLFLCLFMFVIIMSFMLPRALGRTKEMLVEPIIFYISPAKTSEAWTDVSVIGRNFRNKPFIGRIFIDGIEQGFYLVDWTNERVVFRTNPEITKSGLLQVVPLDRKPSNKLQFEYDFK